MVVLSTKKREKKMKKGDGANGKVPFVSLCVGKKGQERKKGARRNFLLTSDDISYNITYRIKKFTLGINK